MYSDNDDSRLYTYSHPGALSQAVSNPGTCWQHEAQRRRNIATELHGVCRTPYSCSDFYWSKCSRRRRFIVKNVTLPYRQCPRLPSRSPRTAHLPPSSLSHCPLHGRASCGVFSTAIGLYVQSNSNSICLTLEPPPARCSHHAHGKHSQPTPLSVECACP